MEHTDLTTGFMSSAFSTVPAWTFSLSTCHIFFHGILVTTFLFTAISCSQLSNTTSLSASSLRKDSIHNCHLFLTSQHIKKAKAFGRSQDQNHLQQLTTHLITAFNTTGSTPSSDHSLAALILQNLPSSSYSMHWLEGAAEQDWWSFWILQGRQPCYRQVDCSLTRMRIIREYAHFCCLHLRNHICIN